ncbi:methyltransferase family protein [Azospirillum baldaniorum]|uniref:methyltransferase domain-containing protein n=1 Tax=Azospirillum baldaniorum TaxID=1064539 RepID=UPI0011A926F9|nr:methyltransferase domain-containing protein [Azospirillum baldaniorum]TWA63487.1 methyltransferase family protein [Azospirillum baldaniorum]
MLDIGCNDGTLLRAYPAASARVGVDPSDIAAGLAGDVTVVNTFFPSEAALTELAGARFDIVTSIAMFYDIEDPCGAAAAIARLLAPDGLWVLELSYPPLMLLRNAFDTVCHEHLEYYNLTVRWASKKAGSSAAVTVMSAPAASRRPCPNAMVSNRQRVSACSGKARRIVRQRSPASLARPA